MTTAAVNRIDGMEPYAEWDWGNMAGGDVGAGVNVAGWGIITVQAIGNGTSVQMQGSMDGGTTWASLATASANLTITAGTSPVTQILEHPLLIRPSVTGGTVTKVIMSAARTSV